MQATIYANLTNNGGTIYPGGNGTAGTLAVTGIYKQTSGGTLAVDVGGTTSVDELTYGTATLAGTLNLSLLGGFGARPDPDLHHPQRRQRLGTSPPSTTPPMVGRTLFTTKYNPSSVVLNGSSTIVVELHRRRGQPGWRLSRHRRHGQRTAADHAWHSPSRPPTC